MNLSSPYFIGIDAVNLASFKEDTVDHQDVMLLKRLAFLFPRGQTFNPYRVAVWIDGRPNPNGLAAGFPRNELEEAERYLLCLPWWEIVHNGYVAEAPSGSGKYEITDEGWAVVESNTGEVDFDDLVAKIFHEPVRPKRGRNRAKRRVTSRFGPRMRNPQKQRKN
jgi:hypothetical protein